MVHAYGLYCILYKAYGSDIIWKIGPWGGQYTTTTTVRVPTTVPSDSSSPEIFHHSLDFAKYSYGQS